MIDSTFLTDQQSISEFSFMFFLIGSIFWEKSIDGLGAIFCANFSFSLCFVHCACLAVYLFFPFFPGQYYLFPRVTILEGVFDGILEMYGRMDGSRRREREGNLNEICLKS